MDRAEFEALLVRVRVVSGDSTRGDWAVKSWDDTSSIMRQARVKFYESILRHLLTKT